MTKGTSQMFITGPEVIKAVTGEQVDMETLGGAMAHNAVSGVAHFATDNEDQTLELTRKLRVICPPTTPNVPRLSSRLTTPGGWTWNSTLLSPLIPANPTI
jgi:propionyl-CoA carboxylase beta chain